LQIEVMEMQEEMVILMV